MKRRTFIALSASSPLILKEFANAKDIKYDEWITIQEVQDILFPQTKTMPSAKEFNSIEYLKQNINHFTFNQDDLKLIFNGAKVFRDTFPEFYTSNQIKKNQIIKEANETNYGSSWITTLIYYGIEAMLADPIYGGNKNQLTWKALNHKTGMPQPKRKYGQKI